MNEFTKLAKGAVEKYIRTGKIISIPDNLPPEFYEKKSGVFVTIRNNNELRGCIGTYRPAHKNLAQEIIMNAIAASSRDHRFLPITQEEVKNLSIEVSLLSTPEKISDISELDPKKYGVIAKCSGGRCGLLLPDLEGVDSSEQQFLIACQKGGIDPLSNKKIEIERFEVKKFN
jgi:AmmeMemoRadiSam system protein A